jgi:hypothetical protein
MVEIIDVNKCPDCGGYWVARGKEKDHWNCMYEPCGHKFKGNHLEDDLDTWLAGDLHLMEIGSQKEEFDAWWARKITNNKRARVIPMGDMISSILPGDRRFAVEGQDPEIMTLELAKRWWKYRLKRNRHKILYHHFGNHEWTIGAQTGEFVRELCLDAGIRYVGFKAHATLHFENGEKLEFITLHGRKAFNSVIPQKDIRRRQRSIDDRIAGYLTLQGEADLIACGHAHRLRVLPPNQSTDPLLRKEEGRLEDYYPSDPTWYVVTGSFMKGYVKGKTTYVEMYSYGALPIGCPKITIRDGEIKNVEEVLV